MPPDWREMMNRADPVMPPDDWPVPFGRYAGQPLSTVLSDPGYCGWLLRTRDLMERYPGLLCWLWVRHAFPDLRRTYTGRAEHAARCAEKALAIIREHESDTWFRMRDLAPLVEQSTGLTTHDARKLLAWLEAHGAILRNDTGGNRIHYLTTGMGPPVPDPEDMTRQFAERCGLTAEYRLSLDRGDS
jgi:hypothetical protein